MRTNWKKCKLGDIITLQRGHDLPKRKMMIGTIPVAGSNGIIGYHNKATTNAPGITIGRSGNLGNAYFFKEDFWAHNTTLYVKDFKGNNELFIYYFLKTFDFKQFNVGSAVPTLNRNHIHPLNVIIPPLPEQKAIAAVLSSLDDKIDLLHRQNKTLEAMAETLFRQWFMEEAQERWKTKVSKLPIEIIDGDRGKNYPKNNELLDTGACLFLNAKNVTANGFNFNQCRFITAVKDAILRSGKLSRKDIVITTRGTVGNIAYYNDLIDYSDIRINSGMFIIRTVCSIVDPIFIFCLVRSRYFKCLIENQTSGSAQPQLPIRDFNQIDVYYPPKNKIDEFLVFAKPCLNKKFYNDSQIKKLEKLRDTLLPRLMSGEVRVEN